MGFGEADTRAKLIDPTIHARGWTEDLIRREETAGAIEIIEGKPRKQARGKVDYTLRVKVTLDLVDVLRKHKLLDADEGRVKSAMGFAMNGLTKVIATAHISDWEDEWPGLLLSKGRDGLETFLEGVEKTAMVPLQDPDEYLPLGDDLWLAQEDPDSTTEKNTEAERKRRATLTEKTRLPGDLRIPHPYAAKTLEQVLDPDVPEHAACAEYAKAPEGRSLVLWGVFSFGLFDVQWAIGRYWFVERLARVVAFDWHTLVEDNLLAQTRAVWTVPHMLIGGLRPIYLSDNEKADPGYAEKLLQHRLRERLLTVITIERLGSVDFGDSGGHHWAASAGGECSPTTA